MAKVTTRFFRIKEDLGPLKLYRQRLRSTFCTPRDAVVVASLGIDGVHFCILPVKGDGTLGNSTVYAVNPRMSGRYVRAVAESFCDFLSLVVAAGDAGAVACAGYHSRAGYDAYQDSMPQDAQSRAARKKAARALQEEFFLREVADPFKAIHMIRHRHRGEPLALRGMGAVSGACPHENEEDS